jgi:hypothetical protein
VRALTPDEEAQLETLVSATSVKHVMEALAQLCYAKAEHIAASTEREDEMLGRDWKRAGDQLQRSADTRAILRVEP